MKIWLRMSWFPWFRCRAREAELDRELRDHLELEAEEQREAGVSPEEATYAARRVLGNTMQIKEDVRMAWRFQWLETLLQDLRFGLHQLRRNPGFAAVAIITLAVAIGANTAIFSVVDAVLLRPLPFRSASHLIALHESIPKMGLPKMAFSVPDFEVFQRDQKSFSRLGVYRNERVDLTGQGEPERVMEARVSASLFPMLGAEPVLGRLFTPQEDRPGIHVALLSYALWQHRYGGTPGILGHAIEINRQPYTIVGVMPQNFEFPLRGPEDNGDPSVLWLQWVLRQRNCRTGAEHSNYSVLGRLRPGLTLDQARSEAESLSHHIVASYPAVMATWARRGELTVSAVPFREDVVGAVQPLLLVLMAAVGFVLLIACANIATLLVSRASARQKEIAVRAAHRTETRLIAQWARRRAPRRARLEGCRGRIPR